MLIIQTCIVQQSQTPGEYVKLLLRIKQNLKFSSLAPLNDLYVTDSEPVLKLNDKDVNFVEKMDEILPNIQRIYQLHN